jgi:hypothetical protein
MFFLRKLKNSQKKKNYPLLFLFLVATLYLVSITHTKKAIPKRIFFLVNTESKGGKGVYEIYKEMKKVGHSVKIVAIPFFSSGKLHADIDLNFLKNLMILILSTLVASKVRTRNAHLLRGLSLNIFLHSTHIIPTKTPLLIHFLQMSI